MCAILSPTCTVLAESELGSTEQSILLITCTHINTSLLSAWLANMPDMVPSCQVRWRVIHFAAATRTFCQCRKETRGNQEQCVGGTQGQIPYHSHSLVEQPCKQGSASMEHHSLLGLPWERLLAGHSSAGRW